MDKDKNIVKIFEYQAKLKNNCCSSNPNDRIYWVVKLLLCGFEPRNFLFSKKDQVLGFVQIQNAPHLTVYLRIKIFESFYFGSIFF